jgi:hypothetical protein
MSIFRLRFFGRIHTCVSVCISVALATLVVLVCSVAPALAVAEAPTILSESALSLTAEEARLEALVNPNNQSTECHFQYGEAAVAENEVACEQPTIEGGEQGVGLTIVSLKQSTLYHYRVILKNTAGEEAVGATESFTTTGPPVLTTGEAQSITRTTATLAGTVNPVGLETFYYYQYGTTTSYGSNAPSIPGVNAGSGTEAVPASVGISGLVPATTYHYRLAATNADGTSYSSPDQTFTTSAAAPPTASTGEASNITLTTATVAGTINPEGLETSYELDLGTDTTYGTSLYGEAGSANTPIQITLGLQGLAPASTYHYRIVAINSDGRTYGTDRTFTTPAYNNPIVQPFTLPLIATPTIAFPTDTTNTGGPNTKTRSQLLAAALKACRKQHGHKRHVCEARAHKRYGPVKKAHRGAARRT